MTHLIFFFLLGMIIPDINKLPFAARRARWARELQCDASTLYRAEIEKRLTRTKENGPPIYTKASILRWLGIEDGIVVESPSLRALRKASRAYRRRKTAV
jgi:hypothetical protein